MKVLVAMLNSFEYYELCHEKKSLEPLFNVEYIKKYEGFQTTEENLKLKENGEVLAGTPEQFIHFMFNPFNKGSFF